MKDYPGSTFTITTIEKNKETRHGTNDAIIFARCSTRGIAPDFFYFLENKEKIELVRKGSETAKEQSFMSGVRLSSNGSASNKGKLYVNLDI